MSVCVSTELAAGLVYTWHYLHMLATHLGLHTNFEDFQVASWYVQVASWYVRLAFDSL